MVFAAYILQTSFCVKQIHFSGRNISPVVVLNFFKFHKVVYQHNTGDVEISMTVT